MSKLNELPERIVIADEDLVLVRGVDLSIDYKATKENFLKDVTEGIETINTTLTTVQDDITDLSEFNLVVANGELNTTQNNILEATSAYTLPSLDSVPDNRYVVMFVPEYAKDNVQTISSVNGDVIQNSGDPDTVLQFNEGVWGSMIVYKHSATEWRI